MSWTPARCWPLPLTNRGSSVVEKVLEGATVSAVNFTEVLGKIIDRGGDAGQVDLYFKGLGIEIVAFDEAQALVAAALIPKC